MFTVNGLDENYGGIGTIGYRLDNTLLEGRVPGNFNSTLSIGRVIPEKYFPKFNIVLRSNDYLEGETVKTPDGKNVGTVESWDPRVGVLNISTGDDFPVGEKIIGQSSNTQGKAVKILSFPTTLETGHSLKWKMDGKHLQGSSMIHYKEFKIVSIIKTSLTH